MLIQVINGVVHGSLLFIVASGLVLLFGLRNVVNFAHGSLYMLGAYVGYTLAGLVGYWLAFLIAVVVLGFVGVALDLLLFRRLQGRDPMVTLIVTFGLVLVFEDLARGVWGRGTLSLNPPDLLAGTVDIFGSAFPVFRLAIVVVGAIVIGALAFWLNFTRSGLYIRASSVDPQTTAIMGVDTDRISLLVVGVGTALAGLSGVLAAPLLSISPSMWSSVLVDSFVIIVVGGLGSFVGAFVVAMVLGQLHVAGAIAFPELSAIAPFVLMAVFLIWKPTGMFGKRTH